MNETIEQIWQTYHASLDRFIRSRVEDPVSADDILQEVFIRIHARIASLKARGKLKSWIYQITRNAIIDHYRRRRRLEGLPQGLAAAEIGAEDRARRDIEGCLLPMIQNLPETYRQAVMLSEIEELTQKQVAERLGLSVSGAKSRVQRGRRMIKDMLSACCRFEFDRRGTMVDYEVKGAGCDRC